MDTLEVLFLEQGASSPAAVARWIAEAVAPARRSIDLAIYDCHLTGEAATIFTGALHEAEHRGVKVRIAYNGLPHTGDRLAIDPGHVDDTAAFFAAAALPARAIVDVHGHASLMHQKYLVVDAGTDEARVVTGSANFTDSAFHLQENNLLRMLSREIADRYTANFEELWTIGEIRGVPGHEHADAIVRYAGKPASVSVLFAPGDGKEIDAAIAERVRGAKRELTIASVIVTSGRILGALAEVADRGIPLSGIVDGTSMHRMKAQWALTPGSVWKADAFESLVRHGSLRGKRSAANGIHDYMHNKVLVIDDTVITGSYNLSHNAQTNAENVLFIESPALAQAYRDYIARLVQRYPHL